MVSRHRHRRARNEDLARRARTLGWRPVAIIVGETLFVGLFVLGGLTLLR